ncbi:hypothetical protein BTM21_02165 [Clostridium chauvoei]|nr:hypothetical protein BTM20_10855 [Clostridium chauvoei]ATD58655.1 hypothetical protein BTM21_02165 [Clostridium chauvoei]
MKKTLLSLTVVALCFNLSYTSVVKALSPETQTIEENKVKYQQLDEGIVSLNTDISKLDGEIAEINAKLEKNNNETTETEVKINLINSQIEEAKKDIDAKQDILNGRLRTMYKSNMTTSMLAYLIDSSNLFEFINRIDSMGRIISLDKQMVTEIKDKQELLIKNANELNEKQEKLKTLRETIEKDLNEVNEKQDKLHSKLDELNSQKAEVASIIEANEEKLISHPLSVVNTDGSTIKQLQDAISTLKSLIPQLNTESVIDKANDGISTGNAKIEEITAANNAANNSNNNDTNSTNNNNNSSENNTNESKKTLTMEATAYTGGTVTAMGFKPVRDPSGISTVSVDPSVIPLGSKVFIPGYGYAIASDTGGDIKGNRIDLYLNSHEECISFGRQSVTVNIVAYPGEW